MKKKYSSTTPLREFSLWLKVIGKRVPLSFDFEITARCNNNCRHCYINLPANDLPAIKKELSIEQIGKLADQAISLGSIWCLLTGGEPLLRADFPEIYLMLKRKGFLVSVFTNACLVTEQHIRLFKKHPPRDIEVTVYGTTQKTYERVTGKSGSYAAFIRGLDLLSSNGFNLHLKAMAIRSNIHEFQDIVSFSRKRTEHNFRFSPLLHLRYDGNPQRNLEIINERLSPQEIVAIEQADKERLKFIKKNCDDYIMPEIEHRNCRHLFHCGAGKRSFVIGFDGFFRLCSSLWHPDCIVDLKKNTLVEAWDGLFPRVRALTSADPEFLGKCHSCPIVNLCLWCPAHAHLESGRLDAWSEYFCQVAHARAEAIELNRVAD